MQLTFLKASLPIVLSAALVAGQQGKPAAQSPQPGAVKQSSAPSAQPKIAKTTKMHHHVARNRHGKSSHRRGAKRAAYRPEFKENSVEVINGASTKHVVFNEDKKPAESGKEQSSQMKVEVVNGTSADTQYFYAGNRVPGTAQSTRPVVVDVQSSDTRAVGGNKRRVVTGITAVGPTDAKSTDSGGQNVTTGVSPQPKRPVYQPETH